MTRSTLRSLLREMLLEYWGEPSGGGNPAPVEKRVDVDALSETDRDPLMLDREGTIVEPDVRKKIKAYLSAMGMMPRDEPGKRWK